MYSLFFPDTILAVIANAFSIHCKIILFIFFAILHWVLLISGNAIFSIHYLYSSPAISEVSRLFLRYLLEIISAPASVHLKTATSSPGL